jgi:hypothetical protein
MRRLSALIGATPDASHPLASRAVRLMFVLLLCAAPLLPELGNSFSSYPVVSHAWVLLPFCGLFLVALLDVSNPWRLLHLDLLVLLSFAVALGFWDRAHPWPLLFVYAPLLYLGVRMAVISRVGQHRHRPPSAKPLRPSLPRSWIIVGIVVLTGVHINWTLDARVNADVGAASVVGAENLLHGRPVYGTHPALVANLGFDPHYDTYGPLTYEAYVPFAGVAVAETAARLAALFFDLLTAALLFVLGRRIRGPTAGVTLAFAWLAFPFTLYTDGLATNDSLVAAALVGTVIVARSPVRRGAMVAIAAWTKLSPLALVPLMAGHNPSGRARRLTLLAFGAAFLLMSAVAFLPALSHSSVSVFLSRTFGYQFGRSQGFTIWERFDAGAVLGNTAWIKTLSGVAHGLITAIAGGFALVLLWAPRRRDVIGLCAASAAVLIALQFCQGYYSFTYTLWFAPLVLVALLLAREERQPPTVPLQEMTVSSLDRPVRISRPLSVTRTRSSIRTPS